ncbi:MAG: PP2C family protein-serine/threonine phosphatase [Flavobacteriales bacterium]|nr:PP2C family protein-serine/threonine phosphatase [Flavobacteriales bacterium]
MAQSSRLAEKVKQRDFKLNALLEITAAINDNRSVSDLLSLYERILRDQLDIGKLTLFAKEDSWRCLLKYGIEDGEIHDISDETFFQAQKNITLISGSHQESFDLTIPILQNEVTIAYLLVGDVDENEKGISPVIKHMKFIQTITNVLVVAIQNRKLQEENIRQERVKKELELAAEMQAILLPHQLPDNDRYEVSAYYKAHQQVGGDYYDFLELNDDHVMLCMADVSGKGVSAAFLMANFQAYLRSIFAYRNGDLVEIVRELNDRVMETAMGEKYITLFLGVYSRSRRILNYVNCGHNPPVIADRNGYTQELKLGTIGLGMFDKLPKVVEGEIKLEPETILVCFTDGLVETENGEHEQYGTPRLEKLILSYFQDRMTDLNDTILQSLNEFRGQEPYNDDIAILSCRFH